MDAIPLRLSVFEPIVFRVYGEPQPFPKKEVGLRKDRRGRVIGVAYFDRDYKTRTNPETGKIEKYDRGYKKRWVEQVQKTALDWMVRHGREPFPKNYPLAMGCMFFVTRAESCKLDFPSQDPDLDNFEYAIWNALKRTPDDKKGFPGRYPDGICFYEDNQIIWRLHPSGVLWADNENPPGVVITIVDAYAIIDDIITGREQVTEIV